MITLILRYQGSIDTYSENNVNKQNRGGRTGDLVTDSGFYSTWNNTNLISDHNLVLSGNNYSFLNDNLGLTLWPVLLQETESLIELV